MFIHRSASLDEPTGKGTDRCGGSKSKNKESAHSKHKGVGHFDSNAMNISIRGKKGHRGSPVSREEFEAILDRFSSLEEVTQGIKGEGVDECGLMFGTFCDLLTECHSCFIVLQVVF